MTTPTTLHTQAADMLERYGRIDGVMHCEVSMLIAELRAAAALDELVRENERLGLYDDQKPVAWRCRDYVTGCWFISVKPDPAGSIAGESVPLYAAPSPAQPRQPLSEEQVRAAIDVWFSYELSNSGMQTRMRSAIEHAIKGDKP